MRTVPEIRISRLNPDGVNARGAYVLYWMTAYRRLGWNFALQHAADLARELEKPLVILEVLLVDYPFASHRLHRFMLDGMVERSGRLENGGAFHYAFVEREPGEGNGLLDALAGEACCVVVDEFPSFFLPRMTKEAAERQNVRFEGVDSNGILPLRATDRVFSAAYHFRRFLQKTLPDHILDAPHPDALGDTPGGEVSPVPNSVLERWPPASKAFLENLRGSLETLPLDRTVPPVPYAGSTEEARRRLDVFLEERLRRYPEDRNHPDRECTSELSPFLHFGTISSHEVMDRIMAWEGWTPLRLSDQADGARAGWWGMGEGAEAFLDQLVTWRELGFNLSSRTSDFARYESLPAWARETLERHESDPRPHLYSMEELETAQTGDSIWNAAQRQLLEEGVIHNYLRMLWGKKILEWTPTARDALDIMIELNDRYAADGRDPNSYSGIFWCLGRYDRGWPERPVFGKVRPMSSDATRRKIKLKNYLHRFSS